MSGPLRHVSALASALAVPAALAIILAITLGAPLFGTRTWLFTVPLVGGAVVLALSAVARARTVRLTKALRTAAQVVALGVALVVALWFSSRLKGHVDISSQGRNSLSEQTVRVANALLQPVAIEARVGRDDRLFADLSALVEQMRSHTTNVQLFRSDDKPTLGDAAVHVLRTDNDGTVRKVPVRVAAVAPDLEQQLTNALLRISDSKRARVYFVSGFGEPQVVDDLPDGLSRLRDALDLEGFEAVPLPPDAAKTLRIPDDAAVVAVVGPVKRLPDASLAVLRSHVERGGRLLVMVEPTVYGTHDETGLDALVGAFGVQILPGTIIDDSPLSSLAGGPEAATGSQSERAHPITRPIGDGLTHFVRSRALAENPGAAARVTSLVLTGREAYLEASATVPRQRDNGEALGPLSLVMSAEEKVGSTRARLVVFGDASCAQNRGLMMGNNRDLVVNAVLWLAERDDAITIRPKGRTGALLLLTPSGRESLAFAMIYGVPVVTALLFSLLRTRKLRRLSLF